MRSGGHTVMPLEKEPRRRPSRAENVVAFIDSGEEDVAEGEGPDPNVDFIEVQDVLLE